MQIPIIGQRGQAKPYPSIPRINWNHPLTSGLISYGYDMGSGPIDLVTGGQRTITNTGAPFGGATPSKYGSGLRSITDNSHATTTALYMLPGGSNIENIAVAAPYSFASGVMITATPGAAVSAHLYLTDDATSANEIVRFTLASSTTTNFGFTFGNGATQNTPTAVLKINTFQTGLGVALTGAAAQCYIDGVLVLSPAVTTTTAAKVGSNPTFFGNRTSASNNYPSGFIYYGALWKGRALTASEARLLHDDPYCFLIYPEDRIFATLGGSRNRYGFTVGRSPLVPRTRMIGY